MSDTPTNASLIEDALHRVDVLQVRVEDGEPPTKEALLALIGWLRTVVLVCEQEMAENERLRKVATTARVEAMRGAADGMRTAARTLTPEIRRALMGAAAEMEAEAAKVSP